MTAWGGRLPRGGLSAAEATTGLVARSGRIMAVVLAGPVVALTITLPILAMTGRGFPVGLAALIVLALAARSRQAAFTSELILTVAAALTGFFALVMGGVRAFAMSGQTAAVTILVIGLAVVGAGVLISVFVPSAAEQAARPGHRPPRRRSRSDAVAVFAAVAIAPVTLGVFGVFGHLMTVGRTLF